MATGARPDTASLTGNTPLHLASKTAVEAVDFFVQQKVNLEIANANGNRPLHKASLEADARNYKKDSYANANIEARNNNGNTPLHRRKPCWQYGGHGCPS